MHLVSADSATGTLSFDSSTGATRTVTISNISGQGTLGINIDAGSGIDVAGNIAPSTVGASFTVGMASGFVLLLDPTGKGALTATGNGSLVVFPGGAIVIDSSNAAAAIATGNAVVTAPEFDITGNPGTSMSGHGTFEGTIHSGVASTADPLASLPAPTLPSPTFNAVNYAGKTALTLSPGTYVGGIHISGQGDVTLQPGIYYLQGGGFSITGKGKVTGNGVMIYNAPAKASDTITIAGQGAMTLAPMSSGTYRGITVFQDRRSTVPLSISGNGATSIIGIFYAAGATLNLTGNGGLDAQGNALDTIGSEYVIDDLTISGNGSVRIGSGSVTKSAAASLAEGESNSRSATAGTTAASSGAALASATHHSDRFAVDAQSPAHAKAAKRTHPLNTPHKRQTPVVHPSVLTRRSPARSNAPRNHDGVQQAKSPAGDTPVDLLTLLALDVSSQHRRRLS